MILLELFWSFIQVGMFSIGGGYAAMPLIQAQVVTTHPWLSMNEFTNLVTIAEMTPGPIAVNAATFVGIRVAGIPGAVVATMGCILPSIIIVSLLAYVYRKYKELSALQNVLACLRPAVVALIASAGLSILLQVIFNGQPMELVHVNWIGILLFLGALYLIKWKKKNPILIMVLCGILYLILGMIMELMGMTPIV